MTGHGIILVWFKNGPFDVLWFVIQYCHYTLHVSWLFSIALVQATFWNAERNRCYIPIWCKTLQMYSCYVIDLKNNLNNKKWRKLHFIRPLQLFSLDIYLQFLHKNDMAHIKSSSLYLQQFTWSFTETSLSFHWTQSLSLNITVRAQTLAVLLSHAQTALKY